MKDNWLKRSAQLRSGLKACTDKIIRKQLTRKIPAFYTEPMEITLDEFRKWLLGGTFKGLNQEEPIELDWRCCYCDQTIGIEGVSVDHNFPLSLGGQTDFGNLAVCCLTCQQRKKDIGGKQFRALIELVEGTDPRLPFWPQKMRDNFWRRMRAVPVFWQGNRGRP